MIIETCSCGAGITVPANQPSLLAEWRTGHRHEPKAAETTPTEPEKAPAVDVKHASSLERRAADRVVGFSVERNPGVRPWW